MKTRTILKLLTARRCRASFSPTALPAAGDNQVAPRVGVAIDPFGNGAVTSIWKIAAGKCRQLRNRAVATICASNDALAYSFVARR